jgi:hypothetical protein
MYRLLFRVVLRRVPAEAAHRAGFWLIRVLGSAAAVPGVAGMLRRWFGPRERSVGESGGAMRWSDFEHAQPRMARLGHERLIKPGVLLVATIRRDGTPRLSPVEPLILDGDLWLSMMWRSAKARDLLRDPRILVHSVVTNRDGAEGEFKVRGIARLEGDAVVLQRYADAVAVSLGWRPEPGRFHLFAVDISHVSYLSYDSRTGDQRVAMWPPGQEFIRRATSETSVGDPEPISDIIS